MTEQDAAASSMEGAPSTPSSDLEGLATGVELTLASVLQGIAVALIIPRAVELIMAGELAKLPYIPATLLLIFIVWVALINHAISVISWPFDPLHNFLYFLIAGSQALLAAILDQPAQWFLALAGFALIMTFNTWYNQRLLERQAARYQTPASRRLYAHIHAEQRTILLYMAGYLLIGIVGHVSLRLRPEFGLPQELGWVVTGFGALVLPLVHAVHQARMLAVRARLLELAHAAPPTH